ncbi:MAG: hypothetical protein ABII79_05860 [bacterium]
MRYDTVVTHDIGFYAGRTLRDVGVKEPPIPIDPILAYFDIELVGIDDSSVDELRRRAGLEMHVPAFMIARGDDAQIVIKAGDSLERQRLSVLHEIGHYDLPWHNGYDFACECASIPDIGLKGFEREAFEYAGLILFPQGCFVADATSMPTEIATIKALSHRYVASFEATTIRYVQAHPGLCAAVYIEPNSNDDDSEHPFRVRYAVKSKRFHRYWRAGDGITYDDSIAVCMNDRVPIETELPATVFGSTRGHDYVVDLKPHGINQVCALLRMDDPQTSFLGGLI